VVACQRKSGISEFLLGSVAAHCAQHSSRPVLVVHAPQPGGSQAAGPGLLGRLASAAAAALGGHPEEEEQRSAAAAAAEQQRRQQVQQPACSVGRHVILAVDDSEASEKACSWAVEHLQRPGDIFHLLRIIPLLPYRAAYGGPVLDGMVFYQPMDVTDSFKTATERYMQHRFEPKLKEAGIPYQVDVLVEATDESVSGVGDSICKRAEELGAAAVVMGSHMSGGLMQFMLGSVAAYVAHHCKQPVAVLH
jgi:nucleotide-binding universal stress UspA family protein